MIVLTCFNATEPGSFKSYDGTTLVNSAFTDPHTSPVIRLVDGIVTQGGGEKTADDPSESEYLSSEDFPEFQKLSLNDALEDEQTQQLVQSVGGSLPEVRCDTPNEASTELEWDIGCTQDIQTGGPRKCGSGEFGAVHTSNEG